MGQLKLSLTDRDADAIRARARERGLPVSTLVRDAVLGERQAVLRPEQVERLDRLQADLGSLTRRLGDLEEADVSDQIEALARRLGRIEALAAGAY